MASTLLLALAFLVLGLVIGALSATIIAKYRWKNTAGMQGAVPRESYELLQEQFTASNSRYRELESELRDKTGALAANEQQLRHAIDKLEAQKGEIGQLREQFRMEFERVANQLLEEKSQKFTRHNHDQLQLLLAPLRERIKSFEEGIEKRFIEETRDRSSLKREIEQLRELNVQLSNDANNLASALKGDNKTQGDWGELQLETLLQRAGLVRTIHYAAQSTFSNEAGKLQRPDFIIHLPENKHLVIDAKVSLSAYERYCSLPEGGEREKALKEHLDSLRRHIRELGGKNYQQLYQINAPDYLILFVPIEPAFGLAIQQDQKIFLDALDRNIVLVSPSTLLATMRTVAFIWRQEKQKKSVLEIARQSGMLYDKFCAFVEELKNIGYRLDQAQAAYKEALHKLSESPRHGDSLIGRAEKIRELGAKASKRLPKTLLDTSGEDREAAPPLIDEQ
ncbi:MAG: DNA recombination protein RmuC [Saprospiraceae bacterium]|jgi:DNA recombination protein RmuC